MGIKGIYAEIEPGSRVALAKLASDKLTESRRPFRLAVDFSIWEFQALAAKGGTNPALRNLFYRLVRLLGLGIQPIFVFDGPHKPGFKRNKPTFRFANALSVSHAKELISLFGFPVHDAPGEAEAECAMLQQHGVVDTVLSEDADTVMFGCTSTIRNWSSEGPTSSKAPTHVTLHTIESGLAGTSRLDRHGMVLAALMSGGDYVPEGIPGCGIRVACEAARAGFGKELCLLDPSDSDGLRNWRERLTHELHTNESGFFKTRHMALRIPDSFPDMNILSHYTSPVVSPASDMARLTRDTVWGAVPDVESLRAFTEHMFDWRYHSNFVRVLSPALLVHRLLAWHANPYSVSARDESSPVAIGSLVKSLGKQRFHHSTDYMAELRVEFLPADLVGRELGSEATRGPSTRGRIKAAAAAASDDDDGDGGGGDDDDGDYGDDGYDSLNTHGTTAPNTDGEPGADNCIDGTEGAPGSRALRPPWILKAVVELGAPVQLGEWEEQQALKQSLVASRSRQRKTRGKKNMRPSVPEEGAILKYFKPATATATAAAEEEVSCADGGPIATGPSSYRKPTCLVQPSQPRLPPSKQSTTTTTTATTLVPAASKAPKPARGNRVLDDYGLQLSSTRTSTASNRKKGLLAAVPCIADIDKPASSAGPFVPFPLLPSTGPLLPPAGNPQVASSLILAVHVEPQQQQRMRRARTRGSNNSSNTNSNNKTKNNNNNNNNTGPSLRQTTLFRFASSSKPNPRPVIAAGRDKGPGVRQGEKGRGDDGPTQTHRQQQQ